MVSAQHYAAALVGVFLYACQTPYTAPLPISKNDRVNPLFGPRKHYEHVIRDSRGQIKEVYRYYFDDHHRPVLDGPRYIYRWEHDPGLIIHYRDGREVDRAEAIVTG
jgi:hypothetical protein